MVRGWVWWWWAQTERAFSQISCWDKLTTYSPNENHMQTGQPMEVFTIRYSFQLLFLLPLQGFWGNWLGVFGRTQCSCLLYHRCGTTWTRSPFRMLALADQLLDFWFCVCGCLPVHLCSFGVAIFSMESFGVLFSIA